MALRQVLHRPGVIRDWDEYDAKGYAISSNLIRWVQGRTESQGGYEVGSQDNVEGVARSIKAWATRVGKRLGLIGTHCNLYAFVGGQVWDVTPERSSGTFAADPFTTVAASTTVSVSHTAHGAVDGDNVIIWNSAAVGGITPGGESVSLSTDPFTVAEGSDIVYTSHPSHGYASGDEVTISGATAVGGITPNGTFIIHVEDTEQYSFQFTAEATSDGTGGGGSVTANYGRRYTVSNVATDSYDIEHHTAASSGATGGGSSAEYRYMINCGNQHGSTGAGFGVGGFGLGPFGTSPNPQIFEETLPRIIFLNTWGEDAIATPLGGRHYFWEGNVSKRATVLSNSPTSSLFSLTTDERFVMAFGCTENGGSFNPLHVRWSGFAQNNVWAPATGNLAGDLDIESGSFIVGAIKVPNGIVCFTDVSMHFIDYTANPDELYTATPIDDIGLIGPNAMAVINGVLFWISPQRQIWAWGGGRPRMIQCGIRDYFADNLAPSQQYKIFCHPDFEFGGLQWHYPTISNDNENELYIRLDVMEQERDPIAGWSDGTWQRSCWLDKGVLDAPIAINENGNIFNQESGNGSNGAALSRHVYWSGGGIEEVADSGIAGDHKVNIDRIVPAAKIDSGTIKIQLSCKDWPSSNERLSIQRTFQPSRGHIDFREEGRQCGVRLNSDGTNDKWTWGTMRVDTKRGTKR